MADAQLFTLFPNLPPEIRQNIWKEALFGSAERVFELQIEDPSDRVHTASVRNMFLKYPNLFLEAFPPITRDPEAVCGDEPADNNGSEPINPEIGLGKNDDNEDSEDDDYDEDYDENDEENYSWIADQYEPRLSRFYDLDSDMESEIWNLLPDSPPPDSAPAPMTLVKVSCPARVPSILLVNQESRAIALLQYSKITVSGVVAYLDFEIDTIFLSKGTWYDHIPFLISEFFTAPFKNEVQNLALDLGIWKKQSENVEDFDDLEDVEAKIWHHWVAELRQMENLRKITLVNEAEYAVTTADEVAEGELIVMEPVSSSGDKLPFELQSRIYGAQMEMKGIHADFPDLEWAANLNLAWVDRCGDEKRKRCKTMMAERSGCKSIEEAIATVMLRGVPEIKV